MPSYAPGRVTPRTSSTVNITKGNVAVMYTTWTGRAEAFAKRSTNPRPNGIWAVVFGRLLTFPVDLTPFQMQKKQMTHTARRHRARSHFRGPMSSMPLEMVRTLRLRTIHKHTQGSVAALLPLPAWMCAACVRTCGQELLTPRTL